MSQFISEDEIKINISYRQMFRGLWPYAKRHPWLLTSSLLSILSVAISSRLMPATVGYAIDKGFNAKDLNAIQLSAILFLLFEVMHACSLFLYQFLFQKYGNKVLFYLRENLVEHTQNLPMQYFNKTPLGRIVTRLTNDTSSLGEVFTDGIINVVTESVVILSIVTSMFLISWKLACATLVSVPIFFSLAYYVTEKIRKTLRISKKQLSILNSFIAENLSGIKVVQLFNRATRSRFQFAKLSMDYTQTLLLSVRYYAILQPIMNLFNAVTITTALYYGGLLGKDSTLTIGAVVAFLMHVQDFVHPLREILEKFQQFQNSLTSAERVFQLLEEKAEEVVASDTKPLQGEIEFKNLNFNYEPNLPLVLKNISFKIKKGQSVAVVGRTGSGKTTLISLLQKFYSAPENSVFIDQVPIEKIDRLFLRKYIGVVQQDNFIFKGTIRENISLLNPQITEEQIIRALKQVGYLDLLQRSNRNLDSLIEEKGANLSVGERQLLAFARILAFSPAVLILDEATANIDSETEKMIQHATETLMQDRTSIIIAHRLSTIKKCDVIIVLDQGEIREMGSHQELLKLNGLYAHVAEAGLNVTNTDLLNSGIESP